MSLAVLHYRFQDFDTQDHRAASKLGFEGADKRGGVS